MRVLLCGRPDLLQKPGGDTRQILTLREALGDAAGLSLELEPDARGYDLVHLFNLSRPVEPYLQGQAARRQGLPLVITTVFQDLERYDRRGRRGLGRLVLGLLGGDGQRLEDTRALLNLYRAGAGALLSRPRLSAGLGAHALGAPGAGAEGLQRWLLGNSAAVVFNSELEARSVASRFGPGATGAARQEIVPVGVDPGEFADADPEPFVRRFGVRDFALCLGRVEDLKNQRNLIHALGPLDIPLVLAGGFNPRHRHYTRTVSRAAAARPGTLLVGPLERKMVASALAAAAVHVLPSWFETAGLASLEAALAGCAVVSTDSGYARAYLGDEADYCDPADPASIRAAVERALERGPSDALRARVLERYTVERGAKMMREVYRAVLAGGEA